MFLPSLLPFAAQNSLTLSEKQAGHVPKSHEYASVEVEGLSDVKN